MEDEKSLIKSTTSIEPSKLEQVRETAARAVARLADAYSANTRRAYAASWRIFGAWCTEHGLDPAAATPEIVVTYLEHRLGNGLSPRACEREYGGLLAYLHEVQPGGPWRTKSPPEIIRRWLKGARKLAVPEVRKKPILPEHLMQLADPERFDSARWLESARDRALLLLGFGGGFRRSELVALDVRNLTFRTEGVVVELVQSKTDQDHKGELVAVWRQDGPHCPVAALETWVKGAKIAAGPVFRRVIDHKLTDKRMSDRSVARIVKAAIASLGLDPDDYAGHSLRCGFVEAAAQRGATIDEIMNTTRHRSATQVIAYMRRATPFERNASKGMFGGSVAADTMMPKPPGYESELGNYEAVLHDAGCGETIGWGFRILRHLGQERFEALKAHGDMQCISMGRWCLVKRWLTPEEARAQFGEVTCIELGPRGGFRSITYGSKRFLSRRLYDPPKMWAACGRGHLHEGEKITAALSQGTAIFCTEGNCGLEAGKPLPHRRIEWRTPAPRASYG